MLDKNRIHKFVTAFTIAAIWCVSSSVVFAMPGKATGEISVSGQVTVNGQAAVSNATILSGETIVSGPDSTAIVSIGKSGRIQLAPNTSVALSFNDSSISGQLTSGNLSVLNAAQPVAVKTLSGETVVLKSGETVSAAGARVVADHRDASGKCIDDNKDGKLDCDKEGGMAWWAWVLIFGGATAGIVWAAHNSNSADLGGSVVIVSPTR